MSYPITLQRASAGSGKTYTLTKKFIRLLISIARDGGKVRLRNASELQDAINHILAVTFTNKATDEMKQRIMSKLAELADYNPAKDSKRPDYLDDFMKEFKVGEEEISGRCRDALKYLLYNYSEFKVSTIDAFFQSMLRTFAYEADLPDSYEVIVDNQYLNKQVVADLLSDIRHRTANEETRKWLKRMIRARENLGQHASDVFNFKEGNQNNPSLFDDLCRIAGEIEKESNKEAREALEEYAEKCRLDGISLEEVYSQIEKSFDDGLKRALERVVKSARAVLQEGNSIEAVTGMALGDYISDGSRNITRLNKLVSADPEKDYAIALSWDKKDWSINNFYAASKFKTKVAKSRLQPVMDMADGLISSLQSLKESHDEWLGMLNDPKYVSWGFLSQGFPRVGLLLDLMDRARNFLLETGAMRLSDTNSMLSRIIGGDELAFIYERYGTRLDHFLIDEFQDTSEMQWENFLPLLNNSRSYRHENLIIGDAKQSIYRFRGADPTLITEKVPEQFAGDIDLRGDLEEENANRRSTRHIVEFNNYVFRNLSEALANKYVQGGENEYAARILDLYGNAVQRPSNDAMEGYVEIDVCRVIKPSDTDLEDEDSTVSADGGADNDKNPEIRQRVLETLIDLLRRGYRQREIAILVNSNATGRQLISYLRDCNRRLPSDLPMLEFVSEDSLTLSSSRGVDIVIDCLRMIQKGVEGKLHPGDGDLLNLSENDGDSGVSRQPARHRKYFNWVDVAPQFRSYSLQPEINGKTLQERLERFLILASVEDEENLSEDERNELSGFREDPMEAILKDMYAVTLPSLVEALAERFVPEELLREDAIYLAALQDAVVEYCKIYPADIASMLKWWDSYGRNTTVISPEDMDAITVMSIHKSKGLEFECVLLPDFNIPLALKNEWTWVEVPDGFPYEEILPELLPVCMNESEKSKKLWYVTPYAKIFKDACYYNMADKVNKAYVAMTRPVSEMYIFLSGGKADFPEDDSSVSDQMEPDGLQVQSAGRNVQKPSYKSIGASLKTMMREAEQPFGGEGEYPVTEENRFMPVAGRVVSVRQIYAEGTSECISYSYGEKIGSVGEFGSSLAVRRKKKGREGGERSVDRYFVNSDRALLHYNPEGKKINTHEGDDDRVDPREEGTKLHAVLENVEVAGDLEKSFRQLRLRGVFSQEEADRYLPLLREALRRVSDRGWFDGSKRVLRERALLKRGVPMRRPDRVMIDSDGNLTVVDYKFKFSQEDSKQRNAHHKQVREYMQELQQALGAPAVEGYLWYINDGFRIEPVGLK